MNYCRCGGVISAGRLALGATKCLKCGEAEAQAEIKAKSFRIAPDYNKGAYQYQGDPETARRRMMEGVGRKNAATPTSVQMLNTGDPYVAPPTAEIPSPDLRVVSQHKFAVKVKRRQVGIYYLGQQAHVWWEGDNPKQFGATRWARFRE